MFFPFLLQVAGQYLQQYEVYYKRLDPEGSGKIPAMDAATFFKKSQLPDETLGKVTWLVYERPTLIFLSMRCEVKRQQILAPKSTPECQDLFNELPHDT